MEHATRPLTEPRTSRDLRRRLLRHHLPLALASAGTEMAMRGVYQKITPPERLVSTESWGGDWPETINTLILTEEDGKTTIASTVLYPSKEARDAALDTGMKEGASQSFDRLAEYVRTMARGHLRPGRRNAGPVLNERWARQADS
jgi:hypothetical protein